MSQTEQSFGFAPEHDAPIPYMQRIRDYYLALGYDTPYRWAHYADGAVPAADQAARRVPCRLDHHRSPLSARQRAIRVPGRPTMRAAKFYTVYSGDSGAEHDLRISHVAIDRAHTTAEDSNTWFPLPQLRRCAAAGRIGEVAPRFHGAPTNRSHRTTLEQDCPELLARCRADGADAAILVAN